MRDSLCVTDRPSRALGINSRQLRFDLRRRQGARPRGGQRDIQREPVRDPRIRSSHVPIAHRCDLSFRRSEDQKVIAFNRSLVSEEYRSLWNLSWVPVSFLRIPTRAACGHRERAALLRRLQHHGPTSLRGWV